MAIDLSRFVATFLEESSEGLDTMESGLLKLDEGNHDVEVINAIFRAAHSMKGGAGSFGFTAITELTHLLETLLDQMRSGKRSISRDAVDALLASVDVLRHLLHAAQANEPVDASRLAEICARLGSILDGAPAATSAPAVAAQPDPAPGGWRIRFQPHPGLFATGNDPLRILTELHALGGCTVCCDLSRLPEFGDLDATVSHLGWTVELEGGVARGTVEELFAWVEGDCELSIEALADVPTTAGSAVAESKGASQAGTAPSATLQRDAGAPTTATGKVVSLHEDRSAPQVAAATESSIRVAVSKVDALINLVGELVITQAMLRQLSETIDPAANEKLINGLSQLDRNTRDLQEAVMGVRMLPVEFVFSRFPRMVRDLAGKLGKEVRIRSLGEGTELDKGVIEKISDPLVHLIRNAVDHGLESPAERRAAGKDECGTITLSASHQGGHIVIEVGDDGRGLDVQRIVEKARSRGIAVADNASDAELFQLIFLPGLSTASAVTDVSGRGVGMDVVKRNIVALGGSIDVWSQRGRGTKITVRLPLTLAILDGMTVAVAEEVFIVPLGFVIESLQLRDSDIRSISGTGRLLRVRGEYLPLVSMASAFGVQQALNERASTIAVIVESEGRRIALEVDELVGQQQVVVKSLDANYRRIHGISGATILGDGRVALIVDVGGITRGLAQAA
jgi:two-component system chemotaxis sensor kinase CheA